MIHFLFRYKEMFSHFPLRIFDFCCMIEDTHTLLRKLYLKYFLMLSLAVIKQTVLSLVTGWL